MPIDQRMGIDMAGSLLGETVNLKVIFDTSFEKPGGGYAFVNQTVYEGNLTVGGGVELNGQAFTYTFQTIYGPMTIDGTLTVDIGASGYVATFSGTSQPSALRFVFSSLNDQSISKVTAATETSENLGPIRYGQDAYVGVDSASVVTSTFFLAGYQPGSYLSHNVDLTFAAAPTNTAPTQAVNTGSTVLEGGTDTITASELRFADAEQAASAITYTLTSLATRGTLRLNGTALAVGGTWTQADIAANRLTYVHNGSEAPNDTFGFSVSDGAGGSVIGRSFALTVMPVNDAPSGTDGRLTMLEDSARIITAADFGFSDVDNNTLAAVRITNLPTAGTLTLNGAAVTAGQSVTLAQLNASQLVYRPAANANGTGYAAMTFQVQDNGGTANGGVDLDQSANELTFDVVAVNDQPEGRDATLNFLEDTVLTLTAANFGFSDIEGDSLAGVRIATLPGAGTLTLNGFPVSIGNVITAGQLAAGQLQYRPAPNGNGTGYASLTFQVQDSGGSSNGGINFDQSPNTLTFNVTSVNDAPNSLGVSITFREDDDLVLMPSHFAFQDVDGNAFAAVRITTLPGAGTLLLGGVAVTAGQLIPVAQLNAGQLIFRPAANANGTNYASLTYQVQDDGGTANGGVDIDPTPATMQINLWSINDAPGGTDKTVTVLEDGSITLGAGDFGFTDIDGNALAAVRITTLPGAGSLRLNGVQVTAGQSVTAAQLAAGQLVFRPAANGNGADYASLTFQVQDDGGTVNGGVDLDATPNRLTFSVTAVNDAPAGSDARVTVVEGQAVGLTAASFGFTDVDGHSFAGIRIASLPGAGALTLNGGAVAVGQFVTAAQIAAGQLQFRPAADTSGTGYANFAFQVQDDGGTANGGANLDPTANTLTFDVTPVNHAPAGTDVTVVSFEDQQIKLTSEFFGFSDVDGDALAGVRITTLPGGGTLNLNGFAVTAGQLITAAQLGRGELTYRPAANANGASYDSLTFQVQDDGGTANGGVNLDASLNRMTFNVNSVNDAPAGTDRTVTLLEDGSYTIRSLDLGFSDIDGNTLAGVRITTLPVAGTLTLNGTAITAGQFVTAAQLAAGQLVFRPAANGNGADYASLTFQVQDDGGTANGGVDLDATPNRLTFSVSAVNDAPTGANRTVTLLEDGSITVATADFGFADADGNALSAVRIWMLPSNGVLTLGGAPVAVGQSISAARIAAGDLVFRPSANFNGTTGLIFQVEDDGGIDNGGISVSQSTNTLTFDVTSVNDAPSGTDKTLTLLEDGSVTLAAGDFGFSDIDGNALAGVRITTLPSAGTLTLNGVAVTAGQLVTTPQLLAGALVFRPAANANGAGYAALTFQVQDDGTIANGGVTTDPTPNRLTFDVTAVNDAPAGADKTLTLLEDGRLTITPADFGFTDVDGDTLSAVRITTLPTAGSLTLNGAAITAGQVIAFADIAAGRLWFAPAANANGTGYAALTFQVRDTGGTANGGVDLDATPNTLTFDVTSVNDAPSGTDKTLTLLEDGSVTLAAGDFGFSDIDGNALAGVRITTLPSAGTLTLNGVAVTAGQLVTTPQLLAGALVFRPAANANGAGYAALTFQVQDDGTIANGGVTTDPTPNRLTFDVTAVNDAPAGADKTLTLLEDGSITLAAGDFGFADIDANALAAVRITTLPAAGMLTLAGVAVTAGQSVTAAQLAAGQLVFRPAANANGADYAGLTFQVQDNGGTANGGIDLDATPNRLTFDVTAVNDAPVAIDDRLPAIDEDRTVTFTAAQLVGNDTDIDGDALRIRTVGGAIGGRVTLNADGTVTFVPNADYNGEASFSYVATDGLADSPAAVARLTVNPVEDAAIARDDLFTVVENGTLVGNVYADNGRGTDSDPDGAIDAVTLIQGRPVLVGRSVALASGGTVRLAANGDLFYTPPADAAARLAAVGSGASNTELRDSFVYGLAGGGTATVTIVVTGRDSADLVLGTAGDDHLRAGAFDDVLMGYQGADVLDGGDGNDTVSYAEDGAAVTVDLAIGGGTGGSAERDFYVSIENAIGTRFNDVLTGNAGVNRLDGGAGNDTLAGGAGADELVGGDGTDAVSYAADEGGVFVNLTLGRGSSNAAEGDRYTGIEDVTGSGYADFLIGDEGVNRLDGGAGDDRLLGGLGADTLIGGAGTDTASFEDNSGTVFINLLTGQGFNNAAQGDILSGIENVIGGLFDDTIIGDHGANRIDGALGSDTLVGNLGADTFVLAHAPSLMSAFNTLNVDTLVDFTSGEDRLEIAAAAFGGGLVAGALASGAFVIGAAAGDGDDRFVYDRANGRLYFDADGNGAGAQVLVAYLPNQQALTAADFVIV